ncbi:MAG TPA: NADP-dependent oxidoreductase [Gemmatimonadaceae bacterium]|nr:NADP-dependent oxidoreductase [Gemmatimonadaceae bacterium]
MKAFILERYGSADAVRAGEMPEPDLKEDEVLVQVRAAGVNPLDIKIRKGELKRILPYRLPIILGHEVAGVVVRVGSQVRRFKAGDEVYARLSKDRTGGFAEFVSISEDAVAIKPKTVTMEEAASIPLVGLTAWQALIERDRSFLDREPGNAAFELSNQKERKTAWRQVFVPDDESERRSIA